MKQVAYPNYVDSSTSVKPAYNLNKWLETMKMLYSKMHFGQLRTNALKEITDGWNEVEKQDFNAWLSFYEGNNHHKYKTAQFYVNDNIPGYFLPNPKVPSPIISDVERREPSPLAEPISAANVELDEKIKKEEKRHLIEEHRKKIISRLNSAIKHLTAHEGHLLAADEFEKLLASLYELTKQFQMVNKISVSGQLYKDLIIREANKLSNVGFARSSSFLYKFSQNSPGGMDFVRGPIPIASKNDNKGTLDNNTPPLADLTAKPPEKAKDKDPLDEIIDNLETSGLTDSNLSEDEENDDLDNISLDDLKVEAQFVPPSNEPAPLLPSAPVAPKITSLAPIDVPNDELNNIKVEDEADSTLVPDHIDNLLDNAFANIRVEDVVSKLEEINAIFQNRVISKELSILDLMVSRLGLTSYLSSLSEVIGKQHEANNYCFSRLSDMLNKLKGAVDKTQLDLMEAPKVPESVKNVQEVLEAEQNKEKERKQNRKNLENEGLDAMEKTPIAPLPPQQEIAQLPQPQVV